MFRSGISVPLVKLLHACPKFRSNVVLFLLHSDGTPVFIFLLQSVLLSFPVVKSAFYGSFNADVDYII